MSDFLFKLLVIGDSSVGKSSLLLRFTDNVFHQYYASTIGVDFKVRTLDVDGSTVKLQVWDTAGQEQFRTLASSYYRGAHGILVVYDITSEKTFGSISYWLDNVERFGGESVTKLLIGNKSDLEARRKISTESGQQFADEHDMRFVETSAKSCENVEEVFLRIAKEIKAVVFPAPYLAESNSIRLGDTIPVQEDTSGSWWYC